MSTSVEARQVEFSSGTVLDVPVSRLGECLPRNFDIQNYQRFQSSFDGSLFCMVCALAAACFRFSSATRCARRAPVHSLNNGCIGEGAVPLCTDLRLLRLTVLSGGFKRRPSTNVDTTS